MAFPRNAGVARASSSVSDATGLFRSALPEDTMRTLSTLLLASLAAPAWATPSNPEPYEPEPIAAEEHARTIEGMKPPKRERPLIAVVALNEGTEVTDFLVPYAVLARSGVADVVAVAPDDGPVTLTPALTIRAHQTLAEFTAAYPDGADYVVVPKISDGDDADVVGFIQAQHTTGATIVSICAGAVTVSATGLLEGRQATTHWYSIEDVQADNPTMEWVPDRRYLADEGVVSTTGVSASMPVSIALVEAIAGPERAADLASELGVPFWDARHDSDAFYLDGPLFRTALKNRWFTLRHDDYGLPVEPGVDEISLAFTADAWSRTYRSQALTVADEPGDVRTANGLVVVPDVIEGDGTRIDTMLAAPTSSRPADSLPAALEDIADRYGDKTALFVAVQLEYGWVPPYEDAPLAQ
jgi:putative intracellular protease/amidase